MPNGTPEQYRSFYGQRVEMSQGVLNMETLALLGFNFDKMVGNIKFPASFWTSLRLLVQNLSKISLEAVSRVEQYSAADTLLNNFGTVTTEETIQPHSELKTKVEKTHAGLSLNMTESKLAFVLMLQQIKQLIVSYHQEQLAVIPTEEAEKKVASYVDQGVGRDGTSTVTKSFSNSQREFSVKRRKNKKLRKRLDSSLKLWTSFINTMETTIFGGNMAIESKLRMA